MSQREEFRWMMLRIKRMAEPWVSAIRSLAAKQNLARRRRKKVGVIYTIHCSVEREQVRLSLSGPVDILMAICCTSQIAAHLFHVMSRVACFRPHQNTTQSLEYPMKSSL